MPRVVIAAGGTAGHVVPALAVADALTEDGADVTTQSFVVTVLPNQELVEVAVEQQVQPGETALVDVFDSTGEKKAEILYENTSSTEPVELLFALYSSNPTPLPRAAEFFDRYNRHFLLGRRSFTEPFHD